MSVTNVCSDSKTLQQIVQPMMCLHCLVVLGLKIFLWKIHPFRRCSPYGLSTKTRKSVSVNIPDYITSYSSTKKSLFIYFSVWLLLSTHWRRRGYCCTISQSMTYTNTFGRTPLDKGSARRKYLYSATRSTQQQTDTHVPGGIRTRKPRKRMAADISLKTAQPPGSVQQSFVLT